MLNAAPRSHHRGDRGDAAAAAPHAACRPEDNRAAKRRATVSQSYSRAKRMRVREDPQLSCVAQRPGWRRRRPDRRTRRHAFLRDTQELLLVVVCNNQPPAALRSACLIPSSTRAPGPAGRRSKSTARSPRARRVCKSRNRLFLSTYYFANPAPAMAPVHGRVASGSVAQAAYLR